MDIVPAIEETTKEGFLEALNKIKDFAHQVHVDFNDGSFQGLKTILPQDLKNLPENINFEAHLMVQNPFDFIPKLKELGFRKFIIQWEIVGNIRDVVEELLNYDVLVGVAIAPESSVSDLEPVLELLDSVTVMSVVPGKQGQEFLPENLKKVQILHDASFFGEIQVDGGINDDNIKEVISFRPESVVVGSHIIKSPNPADSFEHLREIAG